MTILAELQDPVPGRMVDPGDLVAAGDRTLERDAVAERAFAFAARGGEDGDGVALVKNEDVRGRFERQGHAISSAAARAPRSARRS